MLLNTEESSSKGEAVLIMYKNIFFEYNALIELPKYRR